MPPRPLWPTEEDLIRAFIDQHQENVWVAVPARIQSYDSRRQVADVVPLVRDFYPNPNGDGSMLHEDLPVVPSVKVLFPRMGKWFIAMSVTPGDVVQLLVNTLAIGHWRRGNGDVTNAHDLRRQHLAHSVALIGLDTWDTALEHAPPLPESPTDPAAAMVLGSDLTDGMRVSIFNDGSLKIAQGNTVVFQIDTNGMNHLGGPAGQFVALANLVAAQLEALKTAIDSAAVAAGDGGATFKANLMAALEGWPGNLAATKVKAT